MPPDLRHAFRQLRKSPGYVAVAAIIVAIGIGAATAIFSTVNALVLRPIALPESDRLAVVYETNLSRNLPFFSASLVNYYDWTERSHSWASLAAIGQRAMNLTGQGEPELLQVGQFTGNFLGTIGLTPVLGRGFLGEEDRSGRNHVALVSTGFWQRRFGGKPDILGQTLTLDGRPYTIVGVIAPDASLTPELEVAIPFGADRAREDRMNHDVEVIGRLKPGVTLEQADAEMKAVAAQIFAADPTLERGWSTRLQPLAREVVGDNVRTGLYILLGAVGVLLLIACANLSNLIIVRTSGRTHELAIRAALGAGRWRIVRQLIIETLALTLLGGACGLFLAWWAVDLLRTLPLPRAAEISVDFRVLAAAAAATLLTGLLASLGPALKASHAKPQDALKSRAPRSGHGSRVRDAMVVTQIAMSLTLLVGATLLVRSFWKVLRVDPGFATERVLTLSLRPTANANAFYDQLLSRVADRPDVAGAGLVSALPLTRGNTSLNVFPSGASLLAAGQSLQANWRLADGGYFSAMQIPLLLGRTFAGLTPAEARDSVVVSASLARALWGDGDPVGRQIDPGGNKRLLTVIGVVGDIRSARLASEPNPTFYWSRHRFLYGPMSLVVRAVADSNRGDGIAPLVAAIRQAVKSIDPTVPVFRIRTMDELRSDSLAQDRLLLGLLGSFAAFALLLAALGTYGVIAFSVQQRSAEIGIRIALGALPRDVLRLILAQGARLAAVGIVLGSIGACFATRALSTLLYQTPPTDVLSYTLAAATLVLATLLAAFVPARRATRVDPMTALRAE